MFGYPCAFVGGHMFTGLHQANLIVRLPPNDREPLLAMEGASVFEPMVGRPMREYVVAPPALVADPEALTLWLEKGLAYALALPPKAEKPPAAAKKPGGSRRPGGRSG